MLATTVRAEPVRTAQESGIIPQDLNSMWSSLVEDASSAVEMITTGGQVVFANDYSIWFHSKSNLRQPLVGRMLKEFLPEAIADERLKLIQEACLSGKPMAIEGMLRGRLVRTVYRPLPQRHGTGQCVLAVTRICTEQASNRMGTSRMTVRKAKFHDHGDLGRLTARELEILKLIGIGLSTSEIAAKLGRSVKTIEWHRVALGEKMGITNRVELARIAIAAGIVWLDTDTLPEESEPAGTEVVA
jgi:DNA-binding CsgD family transcriptional regulator